MNKNHFVRYGTAAEQKYMREYQHTYDGIAINGSILAHISKAISAFVHQNTKKKFFIDPMTHSFQHELDKIKNSQGAIKSSIRKLITSYGEPISRVETEDRPIRKTDFTKDNKALFVERVLRFQNEHITRNVDEEYRDYIEDDPSLRREPSFLIAPYFYLKQNNVDSWLDLNTEFIRLALKLKKEFGKKEIYGQLVMDKRLLLDARLSNILDQYAEADGLIYWIDGLDETDADETELGTIKDFVKDYHDKYPAKRIISLYGGYFSELLLKDGLYGVVHGLEYGETRDVVPVGGGIPLSKYYLPALHKRIPAATMLSMLKILNITTPKKFHADICNCAVCSRAINSSIDDFNNFIRNKPEPVTIRNRKGGFREIYYPEKESKELCLFHYLETKNAEIKDIKREKKTTLADELNMSFDKFRRFFAEEEIGYLKLWAKITRA